MLLALNAYVAMLVVAFDSKVPVCPLRLRLHDPEESLSGLIFPDR